MALEELIRILCEERGESPPPALDLQQQKDLFRSLCNVRPAAPASDAFLSLQDRFLSQETNCRGVVDVEDLHYDGGIALWQGDIARLKADAIVNACNSALLGCFQPMHNCIDNVIHSAAGVQLRLDCQRAMQGHHLPNGEVVVTPAYNLPSRYVFHTVGPIVQGLQPSSQQVDDLRACYLNCLQRAVDEDIGTIVFCCLSTGVFGYPQGLAAELAVETVQQFIHRSSGLRVVFNVFLDEDYALYEQQLAR